MTTSGETERVGSTYSIPLDQLGQQDRCLNCGAERSEIFCQRCGQRHVQERLSLRAVARELPKRMFALDNGLLFTLLQLWKSPGNVAYNYVRGRRRRYANPLTVFLIAATLQVLVLAIVAPRIKALFVESLEASRARSPAESFAAMDQVLGENANEKMADIYLATMNQGYTYAALLFFCVPFAALLFIVHRRRTEPSYLLGEHLIFSLFTVSQLLICTAIANLITLRIGTAVQLTVSMLLYFSYAIVAHRGFFPRTTPSFLRTMLAFVIAVPIFFVSLLTIFVVSFVGQLLLARAAS